MNLFDKRDAFRGSRETSLSTYFLMMRDLIIRSPMIEDGRFDLDYISSTLNRFHYSGGIESISDIILRAFPEKQDNTYENNRDFDPEENAKIRLWIPILFDGCNRTIGTLDKHININEESSATNFQSFSESVALALRYYVEHKKDKYRF